jgi:hypothetical protein
VKGEEPLTVNTSGKSGAGKCMEAGLGRARIPSGKIFALLYILTDNDSLPREVYRVYANPITGSLLVCVRHLVPPHHQQVTIEGYA